MYNARAVEETQLQSLTRLRRITWGIMQKLLYLYIYYAIIRFASDTNFIRSAWILTESFINVIEPQIYIFAAELKYTLR